jgi:S1-C subfamily serine protease
MNVFRKASLIAALALCGLPVFSPAGEAPAAGAAPQEETEKKLADARQRLEAAAREVGELSSQLGQRFNYQMRLNPDEAPGEGMPREGRRARALIGVGISNSDTRDGARVLNVSPGGPAEEAGVKSGDVITSIAGFDLTKEENPGRALVEKMSQLEPGLKVQVGVLRDGKKMKLDVTPRPMPMRMMGGQGGPIGPGGPMGPGARTFEMPVMPPMPPGGMHGPIERVQRFEFRRDDLGTRFRGMEFASLSERLGTYFGVKSGVLVVRAGGTNYKLQDGDVILTIDGREPSSAQHAGRILRSYQAGEKISLRVQRDRKPQTLDVTAPGGNDD